MSTYSRFSWISGTLHERIYNTTSQFSIHYTYRLQRCMQLLLNCMQLHVTGQSKMSDGSRSPSTRTSPNYNSTDPWDQRPSTRTINKTIICHHSQSLRKTTLIIASLTHPRSGYCRPPNQPRIHQQLNQKKLLHSMSTVHNAGVL